MAYNSTQSYIEQQQQQQQRRETMEGTRYRHSQKSMATTLLARYRH